MGLCFCCLLFISLLLSLALTFQLNEFFITRSESAFKPGTSSWASSGPLSPLPAIHLAQHITSSTLHHFHLKLHCPSNPAHLLLFPALLTLLCICCEQPNRANGQQSKTKKSYSEQTVGPYVWPCQHCNSVNGNVGPLLYQFGPDCHNSSTISQIALNFGDEP